MELEYGDYVEPSQDKEVYLGLLKSLGIEYEDLFGVVVSVKPAYKGSAISIRSLRRDVISTDWNANLFKKVPVPPELKDRCEYVSNISDGNIGMAKLK